MLGGSGSTFTGAFVNPRIDTLATFGGTSASVIGGFSFDANSSTNVYQNNITKAIPSHQTMLYCVKF